MSRTRELLQRAADRRRRLEQPDTSAYRLVNDAGDGLPGITVDRFGPVAVANLYRELPPAEEDALVADVAEVFAPRAVYLKRRPKEARVVATTQKAELAPELPAFGSPMNEIEVRERGLTYRIRPAEGLAVGLYLDMRDGRAFVREQVRGKTVLNCFAYTCAFSVAALAGGAARAVNVDLSRRVLDWGMENAALNGQPAERRDYLSGDVFEWLRRLGKRGERFDWVVLDPPSFSTSRTGRFSAARDYPRLVADAAAVVAPSGVLLACSNLATLTQDRFETLVDKGLQAAGRTGAIRRRLGASSADFPTAPGSAPALKILALDVR